MNKDALADFLKRRRSALQPADVGLRQGSRRRTSGLRREEVADLADISADFYTRLEQRRGCRPSEQTVEALGQALRLTRDERQHLFVLAGHHPPPRLARADEASPGFVKILEHLDTPAQIITDLYITLAQNRQSIALLGDQARYQGLERSLIYRWFTDPRTRDLYDPQDHESYSRNYVAALRAAAHESAREYVECLQAVSREFSALWEHHEVVRRPFAVKRFQHPLVGLVSLDCQTLTAENPRERLVIFTPSTPADARSLQPLVV